MRAKVGEGGDFKINGDDDSFILCLIIYLKNAGLCSNGHGQWRSQPKKVGVRTNFCC